MKNQLVVVLLGLVFALQAHAQQTNSKPEVFKIGTQTIVVPAPDGFVNEYPKNAELKAHFDASMEQGNELIATHVPKAVAARLDTGAKLGHGDLPFFTNIYVPQS